MKGYQSNCVQNVHLIKSHPAAKDDPLVGTKAFEVDLKTFRVLESILEPIKHASTNIRCPAPRGTIKTELLKYSFYVTSY